MIKNVILDIGNVLIEFSWRKHVDSFGFEKEINRRIAEAVFLDEDWNEIDRGVLSDDELLELFIENDPGIENEIRLVMDNISGTLEAFSYTDSWIDELKEKGYKVYLLSNFSGKQLHDSASKLGFMDKADGAILSYRYKLIKPDQRIYKVLFDEFDLIPQECIFFDDREENVIAAQKAGMSAEVFKSRKQAMETLERRENG